MRNIIALVGLPASGKSIASKILEAEGFAIIRFGDITDFELKKRGLTTTEEHENQVRNELRKSYGKDAYAKLNTERISRHKDVVIDGLRSYDEYIYLKKKFGEQIRLVAISCPEEIRHKRMAGRTVRPLSPQESLIRDKRELDVLGVRETLERVDITIENDSEFETFEKSIKNLIPR